MRLGIDASNIRAGGALVHLRELLANSEPQRYGFENVIVWGGRTTLDALPERSWLEPVWQADCDRNILKRSTWQAWTLPRLARSAVDLLFVPGGTHVGNFRPYVTMIQNWLPFDAEEIRRYGVSPQMMRLNLLRKLQMKTLEDSAGVVFLTEFSRRAVEALRRGGQPSIVVPHGVSPRFKAEPRLHRPMSECSEARPFRFLYVSAIEPYKEHGKLIEAIGFLKKSGYPVALDIIGIGRQRFVRELNAALQKTDPNRNFIRYLGLVSYLEIARLYIKADAFVFPSSCETFGMPILEAMYSGLPVACSNKTVMPEVAGDAGVLFTPDASEIARILRDLMDDVEARKTLAEAGYERAAQFTWARASELTFRFLEKVAEREFTKSRQLSPVVPDASDAGEENVCAPEQQPPTDESQDAIVAAYQSDSASYPIEAPFHPSVSYPEYAFSAVASEQNAAYHSVRECLHIAGLDAERFGTPDWNPLRGLVRPGETVLLKPNLVKEKHPRDPNGWSYVLTHGSVIRAVADYVWKALQGKGRVVVADAPQTDSSFDQIARRLGLAEIRDFYRSQGLDLEVIDLRREEWCNVDGVIAERKHLVGDPHGAIAFDLGANSEFVGHNGAGDYYGADYDSREVNRHHTGGHHEYLIAGSAINCDVIFSLPKLKTHKKAGITVALKNLVGINADKNWLPHHTEGRHGDEHPNPGIRHRMERSGAALLRQAAVAIPPLGKWGLRRARKIGTHVFGDTEDVVRSGNWWGNDTIWRTCLDLNKIVLYGNSDGSLREPKLENRKRHFVLVDGIIAGEGRGPMNPDPLAAGVIIFGTHAPSVDAASATIMGFDVAKIPIVRQAFLCQRFPLSSLKWQDVRVISNVNRWNHVLSDFPTEEALNFKPHFGWAGRIEKAPAQKQPTPSRPAKPARRDLRDLDSIYLKLPIPVQHLACSAAGVQINVMRLGQGFRHSLRAAEQRLNWSEAEIQEYRDRLLHQFVVHCERTVPFYRVQFAELGISARDIRSLDDLKALPILTKEQVQAETGRFFSEAVSPRECVIQHTSGTTGAGLRFATTRFSVREQFATWWRYRRMNGIEMDVWCAYFGGRSIVPLQQEKSPFWRYNIPGKQVLFSGYHMSPKNLDSYVDELRRRKIRWLHGYPSLLTLIASHILERGIDLGYQVQWITTGAENLLTQQASVIERAFGKRPVQHYGMTEAIANISECECGSLHVDEDFAAVEFVPNANGSGCRVIGTNFTNFATPLLRYDVMDLVQVSKGACSCGRPGRIVDSIDGRQEDYIVLANGVRLGRLDHVFKDMINIHEAQILQDRPGAITVRVVRSGSYSQVDEEALVREFRKRVLDGTEIKIEYVSSVPRSETGKLRFVVSRCS
jgi:phenylacetate-coenzyme A ligase PaaK-like adenylate-forming protein/glycosyltransferase involved in cell wall biosynthesis/uncharacterized protein (DUF362 family)